MMTAKELIEKLGKLDPDTVIWHWADGCGCCDGGYDTLTLGAHTSEDDVVVVSMDGGRS